MWHYNAIVRVFSSISPSKKSFVCGDLSLPVPDEGIRVCYVIGSEILEASNYWKYISFSSGIEEG